MQKIIRSENGLPVAMEDDGIDMVQHEIDEVLAQIDFKEKLQQEALERVKSAQEDVDEMTKQLYRLYYRLEELR